MNPTHDAILTATPTGTLPSPIARYQQGPTSTPTVTPSPTIAPVDFNKIPTTLAEDYNFVCNSHPMYGCSKILPKSNFKNLVENMENLLDFKKFLDDIIDTLPSPPSISSNKKPPYPTSTGTPSVIPTRNPSPTVLNGTSIPR
jgi:hypothetical protein